MMNDDVSDLCVSSSLAYVVSFALNTYACIGFRSCPVVTGKKFESSITYCPLLFQESKPNFAIIILV